MDRRAFMGAVAVGPLLVLNVTPAQPAQRVYRIGILNSSQKTSDLVGPQTRSATLNAFLSGLQELGYLYGRDFVTEPRGGESNPASYAGLAAELVRLHVDLIVAAGPTLRAVKLATSRIPVVMAAAGGDAVTQGFAQSLARPGGNFTGISGHGVELTAKRLGLLKELVPPAASVAVFWNPADLAYRRAAEAAARQREWNLLWLEIRDAGDLEKAFKVATASRAGGLLVAAGGLLVGHARRVARLAAENRLPAIYHLRVFVDAGGLISYGMDVADVWRRAAAYADKILKGAKPADLPIEEPSKVELVINLRAAKALGLAIPQSLLVRADGVIR